MDPTEKVRAVLAAVDNVLDSTKNVPVSFRPVVQLIDLRYWNCFVYTVHKFLLFSQFYPVMKNTLCLIHRDFQQVLIKRLWSFHEDLSIMPFEEAAPSYGGSSPLSRLRLALLRCFTCQAILKQEDVGFVAVLKLVKGVFIKSSTKFFLWQMAKLHLFIYYSLCHIYLFTFSYISRLHK